MDKDFWVFAVLVLLAVSGPTHLDIPKGSLRERWRRSEYKVNDSPTGSCTDGITRSDISYVFAAAKLLTTTEAAFELFSRRQTGIYTEINALEETGQVMITSADRDGYHQAWRGSPQRLLSAYRREKVPSPDGVNRRAVYPYVGKKLPEASGPGPIGENNSVGALGKKAKAGYPLGRSISPGSDGDYVISHSLSDAHRLLNLPPSNYYSAPQSLIAASLFSFDYTGRGHHETAINFDTSVLPTKEQVAWADAELGVIIHLDINIFSPETFDYAKRETLPTLDQFTPSQLNTDQWIRSAKAAGARYAVLTVKHGTGFCLWPSKANEYNVGHTKWGQGKRDILRSFLASCQKYGVKPGLYYNTNSNSFYGAGYTSLSDSARAAYKKVVLQQLRELWTGYGKMFEIWFDGGITKGGSSGISSEVIAMIKQFQPQAILFQGPLECPNIVRWVGNEDGKAADPQWSRTNETTGSDGVETIASLQGDPAGKYWCPAESDFPIRRNSAWNGGWLWKAGEDSTLFSAKELMKKYQETVGRNTNMLLGMVVDSSGRIPVADSLLLDSLGKGIGHLYSSPLLVKNEIRSRSAEVRLSASATVRVLQLKEDIRQGERIRAFTLEAWSDHHWKIIASGQSVGHCRWQKITSVKAERYRLRILRCDGPVFLKSFALY